MVYGLANVSYEPGSIWITHPFVPGLLVLRDPAGCLMAAMYADPEMRHLPIPVGCLSNLKLFHEDGSTPGQSLSNTGLSDQFDQALGTQPATNSPLPSLDGVKKQRVSARELARRIRAIEPMAVDA